MMGRLRAGAAVVVLTGLAATTPGVANAASAVEIDARADLALDGLLATSVAAQAVAERAVAVLVFPQIVKAGFGVGGQFGEGALRRDGVTVAYYNIASASFGFQIGAQAYAQVLFFMTEDAVALLDRAQGFQLGADANVAVIDRGFGVDVTSTTVFDPVVAFVTDQQGLMAGATIEGSKITRIEPR